MNIAVYCASSIGNDKAYEDIARALGEWIGLNGHTLVYGGGDAGLMGVVSRAAFLHGGQVIGVLPGNIDFICNRPQTWCTQVITMDNLQERKRKMLELGDIFIALPGGFGTLDEITQAIDKSRVGEFHKRAILLNANGFYQPLKNFVSEMIRAGFVQEESMDDVLFADSIEQIENFIFKS